MADSEENINPTVNLGRPFAWELELEARATRRRTGEDVGRLDMLRKAWTAYKRNLVLKGDIDAEEKVPGTEPSSIEDGLSDTLTLHGDPSRISEEERSKLDQIGINLGEIGQSLGSATQKLSELVRSLEGAGGQKGKRKGGRR